MGFKANGPAVSVLASREVVGPVTGPVGGAIGVWEYGDPTFSFCGDSAGLVAASTIFPAGGCGSEIRIVAAGVGVGSLATSTEGVALASGTGVVGLASTAAEPAAEPVTAGAAGFDSWFTGAPVTSVRFLEGLPVAVVARRLACSDERRFATRSR